ncbi:hypothetical protein JZO81_19390 [Enterococcus hulanensis]|uniref:hypothetical protein n=1 Tax=Enterococcus TaxID=1350 RepID=UPI000B5A82EC|nr:MULTISPECIES: hypothetical protein [Enterococcus]MBO0413225.1 hypothetical protein [Enterococcus hulanensis]OTO15108.1 hypothetical protein A5875_004265 [Enterococcus sp. 3H8_DIV0648]
MRLRQRDLRTCYLKKRIITKDEEGNALSDFSKQRSTFQMNVQSAGGKMAVELYGERLPYIKSCKYQGDLINEGENEGDGVCVFVDKDADPDFKIISIQEFSQHKNIMLERV